MQINWILQTKVRKGWKMKLGKVGELHGIVIHVETQSTAVMFSCQTLQAYSWKAVHYKDKIWLAVLSGPEEFCCVLYPPKSRQTSLKCAFCTSEWLRGNDWHNYSTCFALLSQTASWLCVPGPVSKLSLPKWKPNFSLILFDLQDLVCTWFGKS